MRGKVSHRTLAAIMVEEELLRQTQGWNPGEWNWHTMKVSSRENTRERRAHPYQREGVRAYSYQREGGRAHPYQREEVVNRGEGSSRTMGQRLDRQQGLMKDIEKILSWLVVIL